MKNTLKNNRMVFSKITSFLGLALMVCVTTSSCERYEPDPPLANTDWKLVGIYDVKGDTLIKELEQNDCDDCYTIEFGVCTSFIDFQGTPYECEATCCRCKGRMVTVPFYGCYIADYSLSTIDIRLNRVLQEDLYDGEEYSTALNRSQTFELTDTELKLYYSGHNCPDGCYGPGSSTCDSSHIRPSYLLFKKNIKP
jgi:hypothetical protein